MGGQEWGGVSWVDGPLGEAPWAFLAEHCARETGHGAAAHSALEAWGGEGEAGKIEAQTLVLSLHGPL